MIKFKTIIICVAAVLMLSSCSVTQNTLSDPFSEPSGSASENGSVTETYNELTADRNTVTINGVLYRNGFQGDLILRNPKYGTEPLLSNNTGQYYRLEGTEYDLIYNASGENKGVSENIYCRADQWQELSEYYSTSTNFVYRCVARSTGGTSETIAVDEMDIKKLNELVEFCESNAYRANAFADSDNMKAVPSASIGDKTYRFGMSSNDGLFSLNAREFCIVEGVLVYKHREVMSEGNTLIVDLPEELSDYFTTVINNLNSDE